MQTSMTPAPLTNPATAANISRWLNQLQLDLQGDYTDHKTARKRSPQTGQAWRHYRSVFGPPTRAGWTVTDLLPYANYDNVFQPLVFQSLYSFAVERVSSSSPGKAARPDPAVSPPDLGPRKVFIHPKVVLSRNFQRLCDWVDAYAHLATHGCWHIAPIVFDPDPDKRRLAILGVMQRSLPDASAAYREVWEFLLSRSAARFKHSPKWLVVGQAMASREERPWPHRQVDVVLISLWPLLKRHNWTYRDLLKVTRAIVSRPDAYPCQSEQELATYCNCVLGLHKTGKGASSKDAYPPGCDVAFTLLRSNFLPQPTRRI